MRMLKSLKIWLFGFLALAIGISSAQSLNCPDIVTQALEAVEIHCMELGRNQACYGNIQLSAEAQPDVENFVFADTGDIAEVGDILSLDLSPMDEASGNWGVAVMSLQADIPNTLPGQNVTFILFGDVEIENAASEGQSPMQAFYLRTGIGAAACEEAPESALLIQTPEGIEELSFNVNGVDVTVGSTVLFQTEALSDTENEMTVTTVEGTAIVRFDDEVYPAIAGTSMSLPLNDELLPTGRPSLPEAYEAGRFDNLPIDALPRDIEIAPPLENIAGMLERLNNNLPPCNVEGLPLCQDLPSLLLDGMVSRWGSPFTEGQNCVPRPEEVVNATELPPVIGAERPFPFCPAQDRASRPAAPDNIILSFDGDEDGDGILNYDDACPYLIGTAELQGCPETPPDRDGDGWSDGLDLCPYRAGDNRGCPEAPPDRDGDGIADVLDECRDEAGTVALLGCPDRPLDTDNDGFPDDSDACPSDSGTANGCPPDSDRDGIIDANDACPNAFGLAERRGCPAPADSDGDGLVDADDACPNEVGTVDYRGCPPPDTDGDGLIDSQDLCPQEFGTAESSGCPLNDRDQDGVYDYLDQCPDVAGPRQNDGCPGDRDGDGIPNTDDRCPDEAGDPNNYGCPLRDTDQDGVPDVDDDCPTVAGSPNNNGCPARKQKVKGN